MDEWNLTYHTVRPGKLDYVFLIHKNLDFQVGGRSFFIIHYYIKCSKSGNLYNKGFKKLILMFYHCFRAATDVCWAVNMISSLLSIEICVHMINNGNNEIRGGRVERDVGGDKKQ